MDGWISGFHLSLEEGNVNCDRENKSNKTHSRHMKLELTKSQFKSNKCCGKHAGILYTLAKSVLG